MNKAEVLVIDDEPQIRKMLQISLESNDYKVNLAATGREGLTFSASHPPDLILLLSLSTSRLSLISAPSFALSSKATALKVSSDET